MPVTYNFKRGIDLPSWHWLNQFFGGGSYGGAANAYDGSRYIYWAQQTGSTTNGTAGTTQLWRYDTWSNAWQFLISLSSATGSLDIEYDPVRNIVWIIEATSTTSTSWRFFNPNAGSVTAAGTTATGMALSAAISVVLPAATASATSEATIELVSEIDVPANFPISRDLTASTLTGTPTTTALADAAAEFHSGMIGLYVRMTSGAQSGVSRAITAVGSATGLTVQAFPGAPAAGDGYVIEVPGSLAQATGLACSASQSTTTIQAAAAQGWVTNFYKDADVVIVSGTGAGQRRRILSNDGQTLTLMAAATTGNPRTGPWATAPDATSTFRIIPSSDFVYYNPGGATTMYQADVVATTLAWTTLTVLTAATGGGANIFHAPFVAPFSLMVFRGGATSTVYRYDIGPRATNTLTTLWGGETLTTGGSAARVPYRAKFVVHIAASNRMYLFNPATGLLEGFSSLPYAAPSAYSGKRFRFVRTADGADFLYAMRAGGQEFWRVPVEWL